MVVFVGEADPLPARVWYQFRVRPAGGEWRLIRDFGVSSEIEWTAAEWEGAYEMEVSIWDLDSGEVARAAMPFEFVARTAQEPKVSDTAHPLVRLYSAAACPEGSEMLVEFGSALGAPLRTPAKPCQAGRSMNFYLGGLRPNEAYTAAHILRRPGEESRRSTPISFLSGEPPADLPVTTVLATPATPPLERFTVLAPIFPQRPRPSIWTGRSFGTTRERSRS
jgi:hypothetical protein